MKNIIWKTPEGCLGITSLGYIEGISRDYAERLLEDDPNYKNWEIKGTDIPAFPEDKLFRTAWDWLTPDPIIDINIDKAKDIVHIRRRNKRLNELAPLDTEININIANQEKVKSIEAKRQKIRVKYNQMQNNIDRCSTEQELRKIIHSENL